MLRYLGYGFRYYGQRPMPPQTRANWEFFAVLAGRCAPLLPAPAGRPKPALESNTIWVFPPEHKHGWIGEKRRCKAAVLHFGNVFPLLAETAREHGFLQHKLTPAQVRQIETLACNLKPHYDKPVRLSPLYEQYAQLELILIVLEGMATARLPTLATLAEQRVETAMLYFKDHLHERPGIARAARAAGVSSSHLRRLFLGVRNESPRAALQRVTMERAAELLSETSHTTEAIAGQCGFAGAGEFSRAFKSHYKMPPSVWREGILPPYKRPVNIHGHWQMPGDTSRIMRKMRQYGFHR
jgi:AraC-like DNA-binding protein